MLTPGLDAEPTGEWLCLSSPGPPRLDPAAQIGSAVCLWWIAELWVVLRNLQWGGGAPPGLLATSCHFEVILRTPLGPY